MDAGLPDVTLQPKDVDMFTQVWCGCVSQLCYQQLTFSKLWTLRKLWALPNLWALGQKLWALPKLWDLLKLHVHGF